MGDLLHLHRPALRGPRLGLRRGTSATSWYELGLALESQDPARAAAAYERALAGRPGLADAHNNLGRLIHEQDRDHGPRGAASVAESHYRLAICNDPDIALYWFNLGVSIEDQGRVSEAIAAYEHAIALDPRIADAHYNLARLFEAVGRSSDDEVVLRRAVRHLVRYRDLARTA